MRKDRLAYFKKQLIEKQRQLTEEVGRTALYGKDQEDDSIKDLGDQANTAYTREFFFELGNDNRSLLSFGAAPGPMADDVATTELLQRAEDARRLGRPDDAAAVYRQILQSRRGHLGALRGLRDLAVDGSRWREALDLQQRIFGAIGS